MCERELIEVDLELAAHIQLYIALRLQLIAVLMQSSRELHDRFLRLNDDMMYQLQNSCTFRKRCKNSPKGRARLGDTRENVHSLHLSIVTLPSSLSGWQNLREGV